MFGVLFLQGIVVFSFVKYQKEFLNAGDQRLKAIRELLYGIKVIKLRALEDFFNTRIHGIRGRQLKALNAYASILYFILVCDSGDFCCFSSSHARDHANRRIPCLFSHE